MFKVLVVEDDENKRSDILTELAKLGILGGSVASVFDVRSALNELSRECFDLMILDLHLPMFPDSSSDVVKYGGYKILSNLNKEEYRTPSSIIALTSFSDLKSEFQNRFIEQTVLIFSYEEDSWRLALKNRVSLSKKSIRQRERLEKNLKRPQVTILVHGVNTQGEWQNKVAEHLESDSHKVITFKYSHYSPLKIAFNVTRKSQVKWFMKEFEKALINNPKSEFNIICHSFGTYLALRTMEETKIDSLIKFNNIILLGSVMPRNYDFSPIENKFLPNAIINDCGINDLPLILSKLFCFNLGNAGRVGFHTTSGILVNRYFNAGHSIFDDVPQYFENYWKSYLDGNPLPEGQITKTGKINGVIESILDLCSAKFTYISILAIIAYSILN